MLLILHAIMLTLDEIRCTAYFACNSCPSLPRYTEDVYNSYLMMLLRDLGLQAKYLLV